jgi:hypothetical protein
MTFGTGEGRPSEEFVRRFQRHALDLSVDVPLAVQRAFLETEHELRNGSDHLFMVDGIIVQAAAELAAAERILAGKSAPLTMFHHARALFEAHSLAYWLMQDVEQNALRLMKDHLRERDRFEQEAKQSIKTQVTDITNAGRRLLDDAAVKFPPTMFDIVRSDVVLRYDLAFFWKYSSSHVHPGSIGTGQVDAANERTTIEQLAGGSIRHAAGTYRRIVDRYRLQIGEAKQQLEDAESYAEYKYELPPVDGYH